MSEPPTPSTRIFGVVARAAPRVVLIRRGPSKQVLLLTWDTVKHEFHTGQWLKGRIYEERCDLSPSGEKFVYLAANHKGDLGTWNAVSRPPFLTALVLWPNMGTWGGGGLFESERVLQLNSGSLKPADGFKIPPELRVVPIAPWAGRGEDEPIASTRMKRDGWELADAGEVTHYRKGIPYSWELVRPQRWRKTCGPWTLERALLGIHEPDGSWHVYEHRVLDAEGNPAHDLGRSDWADWSTSRELLFAKEGKVGRMVPGSRGLLGEPEELVDLRPLKFEATPPPREALGWKSRVKGRRLK